MVFTRPGDNVLTCTPIYDPYPNLVKTSGNAQSYQIDLTADFLTKAVDANAAAGTSKNTANAFRILKAGGHFIFSCEAAGEDEADPAAGSVSHASPLARALIGKRVGDEATVAGQSVEVVAA